MFYQFRISAFVSNNSSICLLFGFVGVISYDLITRTLGIWSIFTVGSYALLGLLAGIYFKKRNKIRHYVGFSIFGTLVFDAITGFGTGMIAFKQPFMMTLMGQIPFTIYHLMGNVLLAGVVSPLLYKWVVDNKELEVQPVLNRCKTLVGA